MVQLLRYSEFSLPYLKDSGYENALALTTINQFAILLFMPLLPTCIRRFGLKNVLILGMSAWALRYFLFMVPVFAVPALFLHGLAQVFLYTAAYAYANQKAPEELKASAQCFMVFILLGVGALLSGQFYGLMSDTFVVQVGEETVRNWQMIFCVPAVIFTIITILFFVLTKDPEEEVANTREGIK